MTAMHTKGPFEAPGMDGEAFVICTHKNTGKRRTVAHAYTAGDAALFAASPDLLAALKMFIAWDDNSHGTAPAAQHNMAMEAARAALRKAGV